MLQDIVLFPSEERNRRRFSCRRSNKKCGCERGCRVARAWNWDTAVRAPSAPFNQGEICGGEAAGVDYSRRLPT